MLGSLDDAEDVVQEAWLRLNGEHADAVANLDAWLTTVVARICLNTLRARRARSAEQLVPQVPDPVVDPVGESDPEHQAILADAVGLALFVVLDALAPAERLAFVLPDSPVAAQREVVDAFFAAGRAGDLERLVAVLHPDVTLRGDFGPGALRTLRGASHVAASARSYAGPEREVRPAIVNGAAGAVIVIAELPVAVIGFVVRDGRIASIDVLADPTRLARLNLGAAG